MHLVYLYSKKINSESQKLLLESLGDNFPNFAFKIKKNKIYSKNKINLSKTKKSCIKIIKTILSLRSKRIIFEQNKKKKNYSDPLILLKKRKEVTKISEGLFQFQGEFLKVFRATNKYFFNLATKKFRAKDQENPLLWPIDLYNKIDYFSDFPQQTLVISGLKKNHENYKKFSTKYKKENKKKSINLTKHFRNSKYGLQPAVCDNCYYALQNTKSNKNTIYTTYNKVFRDEKSNFDNLDRLISFSVRDIMFVGDKNFVIKTRNRLVKSLKKFFEISKLNCSIEVANDPFFATNIQKNFLQDEFDLKYEILVEIPFLKKK